MKITVFGLGFVGLTHGAVLAEAGHSVVCVDVNNQLITQLKQGEIPFYEPGLNDVLDRSLDADTINFTSDIEYGVKHGDLLFITVGTPSLNNGDADLSSVWDVIGSIASSMQSNKIIINKSTAPIGTAEAIKNEIERIINNRKIALQFDVVANPEFLRQGSAVKDCQFPERVIIGSDSQQACELLKELYSPFTTKPEQLITMSTRSAELTKYAANTILASRLSMINEISNIAEIFKANIDEVVKGIASDIRIGSHFLNPGPGFGGSCFPKDVRALIHMCKKEGYEAHMMKSIEKRNIEQKNHFLNKVIAHFDDDLTGKTIAIWGLSFKAKTSDMRESVSCLFIENLSDLGFKLKVYDPEAMPVAKKLYSSLTDLNFCSSKYLAAENSDCLVILTEWDEFKEVDFHLLKNCLKRPVIFDGRNLFMLDDMIHKGYIYESIGRKSLMV